MIQTYYRLTKPGIIYGNLITAAAGFFLASKGQFDLKLLLAMLVGLGLIIASACVINNIFDRDIDSSMERTKNRALVTGQITKPQALTFAIILVLLGIIILKLLTTNYSLLTALLGFLTYTLLYTPLKSKTVHATLIGSIAGATPPVVGYTAVSHHLDLAAWLLFFILVTWQMPHFYSIAIRRLDEYKAAKIPVLPAVKNIRTTKIYILFYIVLFIMVTMLLRLYKFTGDFYFGIMLILGLFWLMRAILGFKSTDDKLWAKNMFLLSLVILLIFSVTISL